MFYLEMTEEDYFIEIRTVNISRYKYISESNDRFKIKKGKFKIKKIDKSFNSKYGLIMIT